MESVKSGILKIFCSERVFGFALLLATAVLSGVLYLATRDSSSGQPLPSYTLQLELRASLGHGSYNFVYGCIFSDTGVPCKSASSNVEVLPGIFSFVTLSSPAAKGNYQGIRIQLRGNKGESFYLKSAVLQGRKIFDGKNALSLGKIHGLRVLRDSQTGIFIFQVVSDSASFDLDYGFSVEPVKGAAVRYPYAVIVSVLLISLLMFLSVFHRQAAGPVDGDRNTGIAGKLTLRRAALAFLLYGLFALVLLTVVLIFISGDFSIETERTETGTFKVEVSGSPDFSYSSGSRSFFSRRDSVIKVPGNYSDIRVSRLADGTAGAGGFRVVTSSGSCGIDARHFVRAGDLPCKAGRDGSLYVNLDSPGRILRSLIFILSALLVSAVLWYTAFRFLEFGAAVRMMSALIMISAYIGGEVCLNAESANVIFFQNYLALLPDTVLTNISLILFMLLLSVLAFSGSRISSAVSLLVLLGIVIYVAVDWGVSSNFGVRADLSNIVRHTGADNSTVLVFAGNFFRNSGASWMAVVMLADLVIMALSFRLREKRCSLKKYLTLLLVLNLIPFLKVCQNFYTPGSLQTREDIFDIQRDYIQDIRNVYTKSFPLYDWKPDFKTEDGLGMRKNVVILTVESLAVPYSEFFSGLAGYTPELDSLARENVSFLNYHSSGITTVPAIYSILTGKVYFDISPANIDFEYGEALPKIMREEGYSTSAIYSAEDFAGLGDVYRNSGFEHLYGPDEPAYNGEKRYVFNSVADGVLLNHAADLISQFDHEASPHLTFIMTTSSHVPFVSPETGTQDYRETISYVDREIGKFVRKLRENGFFDKGMLVITGDHIPPGLDFAPGELSKYGDDLNRVPLVIIDRDLGRQKFSNVFGHDSLKAVIEYLNLSKFKKYEYQLVPFMESDRDRGATVICPMHLLSTYPAEVMVSGPSGEHGIYNATGDSSEFIGHFLSPEAEKEVAGRVKWFKLEK